MSVPETTLHFNRLIAEGSRSSGSKGIGPQHSSRSRSSSTCGAHGLSRAPSPNEVLMKPVMTSSRGAASPRSSQAAMQRAGGLSMAFSGEAGGKKRGLATLAMSPATLDGTQSATSSFGDFQQHAQQPAYQPLPAGGLSSQFSGVGGGFGSYEPDASPALSPLSATTPHGSQRSPLSEALAITASAPRRAKMPRRQSSPYAAAAEAAMDSDESDGDVAGPGLGGTATGLVSGGAPSTTPSGGWAIVGAPPHLMTSGAMSLPHHAAELYPAGFRPGSVMEGAGRKLRGTEAMRMRNAVLRQTGFLEPQHADNMFADHAGSGAPMHATS